MTFFIWHFEAEIGSLYFTAFDFKILKRDQNLTYPFMYQKSDVCLKNDPPTVCWYLKI